MAGKNIEIKIAATGGDQAAAQINKVTAATTAAADASQKMSREEMLGPELTEMFDRATASADAFNESVEDTGGALEKNVSSIDMRIRAQALGQVAGAFGKLRDFTANAANQVREDAPNMAAALDGVTNNLGRLSDVAQGAAAGMAAGGPLGAAAGALAGLLKQDLTEALGDVINALSGAEQAQQRAADQADEYFKMLRMGPEAYADAVDASDTYKERTDALTTSLGVQMESLKMRNAILASERKAAASKRDAEDAERISEGVPEEDVKADRAKFDAEQKIAAEEDKLRQTEKAGEDAYKLHEQRVQNLEDIINRPLRDNDIEGHNKMFADFDAENVKEETAKNELERANARTMTAREVFGNETASINQDAENEVTRLQRSKNQRLAREKQQTDEKAQRENEKNRRSQLEEELQNRASGLDKTAGRAADQFGSEAGRLDEGSALQKTLVGISKKLADGTNEKEIAQIKQDFENATRGFGGETIAMLREMIAIQVKQAKEVGVLRQQIRNIGK